MQENMIEQNIIIREPSKKLRLLGRNSLEGKWKVSIIGVCVYLLVLYFPPIVFDAIFGKSIGGLFTGSGYGYTYGLDANTYATLYNSMPDYCILSSIYIILVTGALNLSLAIFFLAVFRRHDVRTTDMFLGFEKFGKALGLYLFQSLFIFLWAMLFIVPGIIASIRYSQAFFIFADDPTKGIRQCMDESKAMMKGNKAKAFCLGLSFIGWGLLCAIPSGIVDSIGITISSNEFIISVFSVIGQLFLAPVIVYIYATFAGFYEILAGHLIKQTMPTPVTPEEVIMIHEEVQAKAAEERTEEATDEETNEETNEEAKGSVAEEASAEKEAADEDVQENPDDTEKKDEQ